MSNYTNISSVPALSTLATKNSVVVIDFHATWCGPCRVIAPVFEALARTHASPGKVAFAKVDVDAAQDVAQKYSVQAMPTFVILRNNTEIARVKGADRSGLTSAVERAVQGVKAVASAGGQRLGGYVRDGQIGEKPLGVKAGNWMDRVMLFVVLYLTSLFSIDAIGAARSSGWAVGEGRGGGGGGGGGPPGGPGRRLGEVRGVRRDGGCAGGSCG